MSYFEFFIVFFIYTILFLGLFFFLFRKQKSSEQIDPNLLESSIIKEKLTNFIEISSKNNDSITDNLNSINKELFSFKDRLFSLESYSKKSANDITALFSNGKSVGRIGEDFLYSSLIKLGCIDLSSNISLYHDDEILSYMIDHNIRFSFKKQFLLSNGSIPDCVVFCPIKINSDTYSLKKIIVDSKAIIDALKLSDDEALIDKLSAQMKNLSKKEYFKNLDNSFNNVILFFPFIGVLDLLKDDNFKSYKEMIESFRENRIIFSTSENIFLTLEIILDGYNTHQLQETSKSKQDIIEKSEEILFLQKQFKNGLKERINSSDLVKYLEGTIKREIAIYKYLSQYEEDLDRNKEIQSFLKELENFK